MIGVRREPVTACARVCMFHKPKQFIAANAGAEARPRSPIRLRGCITSLHHLQLASVHRGVGSTRQVRMTKKGPKVRNFKLVISDQYSHVTYTWHGSMNCLKR